MDNSDYVISSYSNRLAVLESHHIEMVTTVDGKYVRNCVLGSHYERVITALGTSVDAKAETQHLNATRDQLKVTLTIRCTLSLFNLLVHYVNSMCQFHYVLGFGRTIERCSPAGVYCTSTTCAS